MWWLPYRGLACVLENQRDGLCSVHVEQTDCENIWEWLLLSLVGFRC